MSEPITREETFLNAISENQSAELTPQTRQEIFLNAIATGQSAGLTPVTREETFYQKIIDNSSGGGGGGSSDFTTCTLTVGENFNERNRLGISIPTTYENSEFYEDSATIKSNLKAGTYTVILYKSKMISSTLYSSITGTGGFTFEDSTLTITGDCAITGAE